MKTTTTPRVPALYVPQAAAAATLAVGEITGGQTKDVSVTNAAFIGSEDRPVQAIFVGEPPDSGLGIIGAWISDGVAGTVQVRFGSFPDTTDFGSVDVFIMVYPPQ